MHEYKDTLKNNKFYINKERDELNKNTLNPTYTKQKLILLHNKTSRENSDAVSKINSSPDRILIDNRQKKTLFNETLKNKKDNLTKKVLGHSNDMNSSFQQNNERTYMNQTLKTNNFFNNKSNEYKAKNMSKSTDRNDPQFNSNKLNHIGANIKNNNNQGENKDNKIIKNQQNYLNKPINKSNVNLRSKQANSNTISNYYSNEKSNMNNVNNNKILNLNSNSQKQIQQADINIGKSVFSLNVCRINFFKLIEILKILIEYLLN